MDKFRISSEWLLIADCSICDIFANDEELDGYGWMVLQQLGGEGKLFLKLLKLLWFFMAIRNTSNISSIFLSINPWPPNCKLISDLINFISHKFQRFYFTFWWNYIILTSSEQTKSWIKSKLPLLPNTLLILLLKSIIKIIFEFIKGLRFLFITQQYNEREKEKTKSPRSRTSTLSSNPFYFFMIHPSHALCSESHHAPIA